MDTYDQIFIYIFSGIALVGVPYVPFRLVLWARKSKKGAILLAASFFWFGFAPDPVFEKNLQIIQEAKEYKGSQDESGEPPTTSEQEKHYKQKEI